MNRKNIHVTIVILILVSFFELKAQISDNSIMFSCNILQDTSNEKATTFCIRSCKYWKNNIVPFAFDESANTDFRRGQVQKAIDSLTSANPNLKFVQRTSQNDYIKFYASDENSSHVGRDGGRQKIKIVSWDSVGVIIHEIMHALGFYHEQSRPDRDQYVIIVRDNICDGGGHNFDLETTGVSANIPYDFNSIMHYGSYAFSKCSDSQSSCISGCGTNVEDYVGKTIEVKPQYAQYANQIGQISYLSYSDKLMLRFMYPNSKDRFINIDVVDIDLSPNGNIIRNGNVIYDALLEVTPNIIDGSKIPEGADIWIMPADYNNAQGIYSKKGITLRAPYGGVTLR